MEYRGTLCEQPYVPCYPDPCQNNGMCQTTSATTYQCICPSGRSYVRLSRIGTSCSFAWMGWSGGAKVSCILCHWGVQLILAYSWARPAILVAGKGRGGMFLFLLFLHIHSCSSFFPVPVFHLFYYLFSFLPLSGRQHKMTHKI